MELVGYLSALFIGATLGIFGGGGSILTVPVLVYLFHISPVIATGYSLFIIGVTSMVGTIRQIKSGLVNFKIAVLFFIPGIAGVFLARKLIVPAIPQHIINFGDFVLNKDTAILLFFSIIMLLAAFSMIHDKKSNDLQDDIPIKLNIIRITTQSFFIGVITGIVGAGGGFMIIPALVLLARLPMKEAVSTSVFIISINSLVGFTGNLGGKNIYDWNFLMLFSSLTIVGILAGIYFSKFIPSKKLKPAFGWFILIMGTFIILKETIF